MTLQFRTISAPYDRSSSAALALTDIRWSVVSAFLASALASAALFAASAGYARKETAVGYVSPVAGTIRVTSPRPGTLTAMFVATGDKVAAGDVLFTVDTRHTLEDGRTLDAALRDGLQRQVALISEQVAAEEARAVAEAGRLRSRGQGLLAELEALSVQRQLQAERVAVSGERLKALADLRSRGYVSDAEYRAREEAWLGQRQGLAALDQRIAALTHERDQVAIQSTQVTPDSADRLARLGAARAELEQRMAEVEAQGALSVRATAPGRVTAVQAQPGQRLDSSKPVLSLVPEGSPLQAELFVSGRAIGFVKPGQQVRLMYDAFSFQRFGAQEGKVESVSEIMLTPDEVLGPLRLQEPAYRIVVSLNRSTIPAFGRDMPLQPDMTLKADIILEKRTLLEWLMEPLLSARGRM